MKNFLAVDTGSKYMTVLAVKDGKRTAIFEPDCSMRHSVKLMNAVDEVLKRADASLEDFDFFACVVGAGSFTGIRIGISTVKGFSSSTGKPTLPVTSFDLAAYNVKEARGESGKILVLCDALHSAYYACGYDEQNRVILSPAYLTENEVLALKEEGFLLVSLEQVPMETRLVDPAEGLYKAAVALSEQVEKFGELNALYVRKSQAEINLEEAQKKAGGEI
ncbi:MAG: tRNA (adenosine(37)-N6)-threonylcarbamoyltransferase complex dimerization subunit type 1 TsaB [Clostridia bacterium]|nr:tRNA (adenosine(37)-N6)-threonylcarbamoyltransferase complex dimerization subunit type 1 TsaB [Clostridia bacterium]